jgi:hypothetical protein
MSPIWLIFLKPGRKEANCHDDDEKKGYNDDFPAGCDHVRLSDRMRGTALQTG